MRQQKTVGETLSLAAYLWELGVGSACICCGAPLRWRSGSETSNSKDRTRSPLDKVGALGCPECGCEISGVTTENVAAEPHRGLNRAA